MKVLHVIPSISQAHGGPSRAMTIIEAAIAEAGVKVTIATTNDDGPGRRLPALARENLANGTTRIFVRKWFDFYKFAPGLVPWLWRNVRRFEVVHVHALFSFPSTAAAMVARARGVPYVIRPLGTLTNYGLSRRRPWLKRLSLAMIEGPILRASAALHFTSRAEWDEAAALGIPFRGIVVPIGVDADEPGDAGALLQEFSALNGSRRLLFLSRVDPKKNIEALLRAFRLLDPRYEPLCLMIAGDGKPSYVAELKTLAQSLGIADRVIWLGHVEGSRKAATFAAADIFVLPSFSENFGIAVVEALLAGLPCVLGRGVAIGGEVEDAGVGLLAAPEPSAIAAALEKLLTGDSLRREMGAKAKSFAESQYSSRMMAQQLLAAYKDISQRRAAGSP